MVKNEYRGRGECERASEPLNEGGRRSTSCCDEDLFHGEYTINIAVCDHYVVQTQVVVWGEPNYV